MAGQGFKAANRRIAPCLRSAACRPSAPQQCERTPADARGASSANARHFGAAAAFVVGAFDLAQSLADDRHRRSRSSPIARPPTLHCFQVAKKDPAGREVCAGLELIAVWGSGAGDPPVHGRRASVVRGAQLGGRRSGSRSRLGSRNCSKAGTWPSESALPRAGNVPRLEIGGLHIWTGHAGSALVSHRSGHVRGAAAHWEAHLRGPRGYSPLTVRARPPVCASGSQRERLTRHRDDCASAEEKRGTAPLAASSLMPLRRDVSLSGRLLERVPRGW